MAKNLCLVDSVIDSIFSIPAQILATTFPKEKKVSIYTPTQLKTILSDRAVQIRLSKWVADYLRPLENNELYLQVAKDPRVRFTLTTETIKSVFNILRPYIALGTPAHDLGHHVRDSLGGAALLSQDLFLMSAHHNEQVAALFAAAFHDGSTGVQHRYVDNEWELNHGELMATIFYSFTAHLLPEPIRRLTAYAIAAHPHMLKDMTTKNGFTRKPWKDEMFYDNGRPVRVAVWVCRWTDRLENGGDFASMFGRHLLASADGVRVNGTDLSKTDWYSFTDQIKYIFTPRAETIESIVGTNPDGTNKISKTPTTLQHLKNYANSATASNSPYNQHDSKSPSMRRLMDWKINNSHTGISLVESDPATTEIPNFETLAKVLRMISGFPISNANLQTIEDVHSVWNHLESEDQVKWAKGFEFIQSSYYGWLILLTQEINGASNPIVKAFAPLVPHLIDQVTRF